MATHASIAFKQNDETILQIYHHWDGYPQVLGRKLKRYIIGKKIVNGIGKDKNVFNGFTCLAASVLCHLKDNKAGNVYIKPPSKNMFDMGEEYHYEIYEDKEGINIKIYHANKDIISYDGLLKYANMEQI